MKQVPFWELTFSFSRLAGYVIAAWKVTPQNSLRSKGTSTSAIKRPCHFDLPLFPIQASVSPASDSGAVAKGTAAE